MTAIAGELVEFEQFFAPASTDMVDALIGQYRQERERIEKVADLMATELGTTVQYFADGNKRREQWYGLERLFQLDGAVAALNSSYWNRTLKLTDVIDCMPQKRRDEWFEQIREHKAPEFTEATVRDTLGSLMAMRSQFFAERVDGLFRALSGDHVTNQPQGFGKRMIIARILSSCGTIETGRVGYINDLRCVIAKFMGRDEPGYSATDGVIKFCRDRTGEWVAVDGGALRIRVYAGVGTAHLEVHPDMAWRLNGVLASLYPAAIPPKFRERPKRKPKEHALMQRPLPFAVLRYLASAKEHRVKTDDFRNPWRPVARTRTIFVTDADRFAQAEAERILESIGGARETDRAGHAVFHFDYEPEQVIREIVCSGCIPDDKSHQFYPTPDSVAEAAIELAQIEPGNACLEPSAGTGALADRMGATTLCVEISALRCAILEAKGYTTINADFLAITRAHVQPDRIVMNPPFSDGRWQAHLAHAATLLNKGGRLVAILPASAKGKDLLPGWQCEWSQVFDNEFAGTSVSVVILVGTNG